MPMRLSFYKLHALGNSYVYIPLLHDEDAEAAIDYPSFSKHVSLPTTGVGSDGLILLRRPRLSSVNSCWMRIFNKDGSEALSCGNGLRCVAFLLDHLHLHCSPAVATTTSSCRPSSPSSCCNVFRVENSASQVSECRVFRDSGMVQISMNVVSVQNRTGPLNAWADNRNDRDIHSGSESEDVLVNVGNLHLVRLFADVDMEVDDEYLRTVGSEVERTTDRNFICVSILGQKRVRMRVWERGSGITRACGTGACAGVAALCHSLQLSYSIVSENDRNERGVEVVMDGGSVWIRLDPRGNVLMTGEAVMICEGTIIVPDSCLLSHS
eukprot:ANDGO_00326.mRNA.1 Diaminopimelate epimerase